MFIIATLITIKEYEMCTLRMKDNSWLYDFFFSASMRKHSWFLCVRLYLIYTADMALGKKITER